MRIDFQIYRETVLRICHQKHLTISAFFGLPSWEKEQLILFDRDRNKKLTETLDKLKNDEGKLSLEAYVPFYLAIHG
jgi:hypothetical protein